MRPLISPVDEEAKENAPSPWDQSKGVQDMYSPGCSVGRICSDGMFKLHS